MKYTYLFPNLDKNTQFSKTLRKNSKYRNKENFYSFENDNLKVYDGYELNCHHITTDSLWNVVWPKFVKDLNIDFNPDDFELVKFEEKGFDLSYHRYKGDVLIKFIDYDNMDYYITEGTDGIRQLDGSAISGYHGLYAGAHKVSGVLNQLAKTDKKLIMFTDSMTIPLIPLLTVYYKSIVVVDYRNEYNFNFDETKFDDVVTAYVVWNAANAK